MVSFLRGWPGTRRFRFRGAMRDPRYAAHLETTLTQAIVHMEITSLCNFQCYYCKSPDELRAKRFMSMELVDHLIPQLADVTQEAIRLHIDGEPMLHPQFDEIAAKVNAAGHRIALSSNGSNLGPRSLGHDMDIRIYLSKSPAELAKRSKMPFATYRKKIADYVRAWRASDSRQNLHFMLYGDQGQPFDRTAQRAEAAAFLRECGIRDGHEESPWPTVILEHRKDNGALVLCEEQEIVLGGVYTERPDQDETPADRGFCDSAWRTLAILADGRLSYCCMDLSGSTAVTEPRDILAHPLRELWLEHPKLKQVREQTLQGYIHNETCQQCLAGPYCSNRELYVGWGPEFRPDR